MPFPDDTFDVALAMHMLYHVPDRPRALAELRRVVHCGGAVLVVTNSESHLRELDELLVGASAWRAHRPRSSRSPSENGFAELSDVFATVVLHEFVSELVLTDAAPVLAYAGSMSVFAGCETGSSRGWPRSIAGSARRSQREGAFRVRTAVGCFVC